MVNPDPIDLKSLQTFKKNYPPKSASMLYLTSNYFTNSFILTHILGHAKLEDARSLT